MISCQVSFAAIRDVLNAITLIRHAKLWVPVGAVGDAMRNSCGADDDAFSPQLERSGITVTVARLRPITRRSSKVAGSNYLGDATAGHYCSSKWHVRQFALPLQDQAGARSFSQSIRVQGVFWGDRSSLTSRAASSSSF